MTQSINERLEYAGAKRYHSGHRVYRSKVSFRTKSIQELDIIQDTEYTGARYHSGHRIYRSREISYLD